jgi:hypothetical protein
MPVLVQILPSLAGPRSVETVAAHLAASCEPTADLPDCIEHLTIRLGRESSHKIVKHRAIPKRPKLGVGHVNTLDVHVITQVARMPHYK